MIARFEKRLFSNRVHTSAYRYKSLQNLPHWHMEHEIVYVYEGTAEIMVKNDFFTLSAGMGAFIGSGEIHYIKAASGSLTDVIKIDAEYVRQIVGAKHLEHPILKRSYPIERMFAEISAELRDEKQYYAMIADSIVTRLTAEIFRGEPVYLQQGEVFKISTKQKELLEWLSIHYAHVTFEDAAAYMSFSQPYFSKYFQRISGMTFTNYLNTLKIGAAVEQILKGGMSVTEISAACGFGTIRNFNRVFKMMTGYSPRQLPADYVFLYNFKDTADHGFDPTLNCSEIVPL